MSTPGEKPMSATEAKEVLQTLSIAAGYGRVEPGNGYCKCPSHLILAYMEQKAKEATELLVALKDCLASGEEADWGNARAAISKSEESEDLLKERAARIAAEARLSDLKREMRPVPTAPQTAGQLLAARVNQLEQERDMITVKLDCGHERSQWVDSQVPKECWCNKCGQFRKVVSALSGEEPRESN